MVLGGGVITIKLVPNYATPTVLLLLMAWALQLQRLLHLQLQYLTHSEESYPGRTSQSVRFYGNSSFSVPEDLLASLTGLKGYSVALYFKEQSPNGYAQLYCMLYKTLLS